MEKNIVQNQAWCVRVGASAIKQTHFGSRQGRNLESETERAETTATQLSYGQTLQQITTPNMEYTSYTAMVWLTFNINYEYNHTLLTSATVAGALESYLHRQAEFISYRNIKLYSRGPFI